MLICDYCSRDLNNIWQANMSPQPFLVVCEDCSGYVNRMDLQQENNNEQINLENGEG
jgi:hypothetical protein